MFIKVKNNYLLSDQFMSDKYKNKGKQIYIDILYKYLYIICNNRIIKYDLDHIFYYIFSNADYFYNISLTYDNTIILCIKKNNYALHKLYENIKLLFNNQFTYFYYHLLYIYFINKNVIKLIQKKYFNFPDIYTIKLFYASYNLRIYQYIYEESNDYKYI